jgi:hypothetical protein
MATVRTYPPTLADVRAAIFDFPGLAKSSDTTLNMAMDTAEGEIEQANSWAAAPLGLSPRLNRSLWVLCIDLIIWRLRWRVERDTDTNDVPKALQTQRAELLMRITALDVETPDETARYLVATYDPIDNPDMPVDSGMY